MVTLQKFWDFYQDKEKSQDLIWKPLGTIVASMFLPLLKLSGDKAFLHNLDLMKKLQDLDIKSYIADIKPVFHMIVT